MENPIIAIVNDKDLSNAYDNQLCLSDKVEGERISKLIEFHTKNMLRFLDLQEIDDIFYTYEFSNAVHNYDSIPIVDFLNCREYTTRILRYAADGMNLEAIFNTPDFRYLLSHHHKIAFVPYLDNGKLEEKFKLLEDVPFGFAPFFSHSMFRLLKGGGEKKIKICSVCNSFFVSRDPRRTICYSTSCKAEYHRKDMKKRREDNPIKYCC